MVTILLGLFVITAGSAVSQIASDVTVSQDGASASTTITSPVFTTSAANEQLLAFIATDYLSGTNTTVKSVSAGGLTWSLVRRTNAQSGSAEIWGAFAAAPLTGVSVSATLSQKVVASITVMSFTGVNPAGAIGATAGGSAATGAPTASLVTSGSNSWVLGVGNDYTNATARTVGAGQTLIHQDLTKTGDTYWVQRVSSPIPTSGTTATINDTAPTKDQYNLSIVELLAGLSTGATYTISGTDFTCCERKRRNGHVERSVIRDHSRRCEWQLLIHRVSQWLLHGDAEQDRLYVHSDEPVRHRERSESDGSEFLGSVHCFLEYFRHHQPDFRRSRCDSHIEWNVNRDHDGRRERKLLTHRIGQRFLHGDSE